MRHKAAALLKNWSGRREANPRDGKLERLLPNMLPKPNLFYAELHQIVTALLQNTTAQVRPKRSRSKDRSANHYR